MPFLQTLGRTVKARANTACAMAALFAAALGTPLAQANETQFALTCIGTETGNRINFEYRWGADGSWRSTSVEPGSWKVISYRYDYPGQNRSPRLELRFDDDLSSGVSMARQRVVSYAARQKRCEAEGATFSFVNRGGELFLVPSSDL